MKKTKKRKKENKKIIEKKSLSISNYGDIVVIRNRITISALFSGCLMLALCIACGVVMKEAWKLPMFGIAFSLVAFAIVYSFISILFNKVILDAPNMQMNVYNPFKKQYKFEDVNYVEIKSSKPKDGVILHKVITYIGDGKKNVELTTMSLKQAEELASLLRGMLDNAAMIYPEGNEEPFDFDDTEKTKQGIISFGLKKNKKNDSKEKNAHKTNKEEQKSIDTPKTDEKESSGKETPLVADNSADEKKQIKNDTYFEKEEIEKKPRSENSAEDE